MEFAIRRAEPGEAPALTALARESKASWGYPPAWLEQWAPDLTISREYVRDHRVYVAEAASIVTGVCALEDHGAHWSLEHLWVSPRSQRSGVGRALVRHALGEAARADPKPVRVISDPNAADFYRRLGARDAGSSPAPMPGAPERLLPILEFPAGVI